LISVLSQTFRALIYSRMKVGMERYAREYPAADVVLFEPAADDEVMFFSNMFSYADRRELAEHAYRHTRSELRRRADALDAVLARHGARLDRCVLADPDRRMPEGGEFVAGDQLRESLAPLDGALDRLARALSGMERLRGEGGTPNGAQEAASDA
jgi:acyl-CoA synthetase (AMP-forming)/AMP-acid ligase II